LTGCRSWGFSDIPTLDFWPVSPDIGPESMGLITP
jgi:hypothetical protein